MYGNGIIDENVMFGPETLILLNIAIEDNARVGDNC